MFCLLILIGVISARAGDLFLLFLGNRLAVDIAYKNHSGFTSCFILKFIDLKSAVFKPKGFDVAIGCQKAYIEPDFSRLKTEKAIVLKCTLKNASLLSTEEHLKDANAFFAHLNGNLPLLIGKLTNILYDNMQTELIVYSDRVGFPYYEARSKDIRLSSFGIMTNKGDINIKVKIYFSPEITKDFPEEIQSILTQESKGWASYYLCIEKGADKSFLKLESGRFKVDFEKVESH